MHTKNMQVCIHNPLIALLTQLRDNIPVTFTAPEKFFK